MCLCLRDWTMDKSLQIVELPEGRQARAKTVLHRSPLVQITATFAALAADLSSVACAACEIAPQKQRNANALLNARIPHTSETKELRDR